MIYYPLSTLMLAGIRDVLLITTPHDADAVPAPARRRLAVRHLDLATPQQPQPDGLAQAFIIGADFIGGEPARSGARRQHLLRARPRPQLDAVRRHRRRRGLRLLGRRPRRRTASSSSTTTAGRCRSRRSRPSPEQLRRPGPLLLRQRRRRDRPRPEALGPRRVRDHRRQPHLPRRRDACRSRCSPRGTAWLDTGTFDSLMRRRQLRPHRRAPAGPQDRLPRGGRLAAGLARRRRAAPQRAERWPSPGTAPTCSDPGPWPLSRRAYRRPAISGRARQAEHPLGDDVALHLAGAAADGEGRGEQEAVVPRSGRRASGPASASIPAGAGEVLGQAHDVLAVLVGEHLADRRLGPGLLALDARR